MDDTVIQCPKCGHTWDENNAAGLGEWEIIDREGHHGVAETFDEIECPQCHRRLVVTYRCHVHFVSPEDLELDDYTVMDAVEVSE